MGRIVRVDRKIEEEGCSTCWVHKNVTIQDVFRSNPFNLKSERSKLLNTPSLIFRNYILRVYGVFELEDCAIRILEFSSLFGKKGS